MDRPRLVGWSSLHRARHRSLTSLVPVACTASPVSSRREAPAEPRSPPHRPLQSNASDDRNAFHRVATERVSPSGEARGAIWAMAARACTHRLTSEPPPRASARTAVSSSASAAPSIRLATHRAERRAMRRTDICRLTSSYEHPRLVGSRGRPALARLRHWGDRLLHGSAIRFGGPHVLNVSTAPGVVFPVRGVRSEPLAPLSPLSRVRCRSRAHASVGAAEIVLAPSA